MTPTVIFAGPAEWRPLYAPHLQPAADRAGLAWRLFMDPAEVAREEVDYMIFAANGPVQEFAGFKRLRAILNLWAGVEAAMKLDPPREVPFVRMVEDGLTLGMIDYVVGHVCRHHLDIDRYIGADPIEIWERDYPPLARDRRVAILGLGALGRACAAKLTGLGFRVSGWARTPRDMPGVTCRTGADGLRETLAEAQILVLLLPHTAETERVIDAAALAAMPKSACLINAGRGPLIDHDALLAALDTGHVRHATMDVFDVEPLPPSHPYWAHPRVTVTPHIASVTRPETACDALVARIRTDLAGEPLPHTVDRSLGY